MPYQFKLHISFIANPSTLTNLVWKIWKKNQQNNNNCKLKSKFQTDLCLHWSLRQTHSSLTCWRLYQWVYLKLNFLFDNEYHVQCFIIIIYTFNCRGMAVLTLFFTIFELLSTLNNWITTFKSWATRLFNIIAQVGTIFQKLHVM